MAGSSCKVVKTARRSEGLGRKLQARAEPWITVSGGMLWVLTTLGLVRSSGGKHSGRETGCVEKSGKLQDRDVRTVVLYQGSCVRFTGRGGNYFFLKVQVPVSSSRAVSCQFRAQGESRAPPDAGAGDAGLGQAGGRRGGQGLLASTSDRCSEASPTGAGLGGLGFVGAARGTGGGSAGGEPREPPRTAHFQRGCRPAS